MFLEDYFIYDGINGYVIIDKLPSKIGKGFKYLEYILIVNDIIQAGYHSYNSHHSFEQGFINVSLTIGKNVVAYIISTKVAYSLGKKVATKLGAKIGSFAGPVGAFIGAISGATIGWLIDAFGDEVIKWIVSWFD